MPTKQRRYPLKTKEAKNVLQQASAKLGLDLEAEYGGKSGVEVVESDVGLIYMLSGKPALIKLGETFLPTLLFSEFASKAAKIVVDMGAVPYVCKGADVMAPEITRIEGDFQKGDFVLVVDLKFGKALAVGEALMDSESAKTTKKGPIVKTLHFVSDKIWDYIKTLSA